MYEHLSLTPVIKGKSFKLTPLSMVFIVGFPCVLYLIESVLLYS